MALIVIPAESPVVNVPGDHILLGADYGRSADDLTLTSEDGDDIVVIEGYFAEVPAPALSQEGGASIPGDLVIALANVGSSFADAGLGAPIGQVSFVDGEATATLPGGSEVRLLPGDAVFQDSLIETGASGALGIKLMDGTVLNLSANGRLMLDEFVYDPATDLGTSALTVLRGLLSTITGQIGETAPESVSVRTVMGTIGIRGTTFVVQVDGVGRVEITVVEGAVFVTLPDGQIFELDDAGDFLTIETDGSAAPVVEGADDRLDALRENTGFHLALERAQQAAATQESQSEGSGQSEDIGVSGSGDIDGAADGSEQREAEEESGTSGQDTSGTQRPSGETTETEIANSIPKFHADEFFFSLAENQDGSATAIRVGAVTATDADESESLIYSILPGGDAARFIIDAASGALSYTGSGEDYETTTSLQFTVRASDGMHSADVVVTVAIADVNEAPVFSAPSYNFGLDENAYGIEEGIELGRVSASDPDVGGTITYSIVPGNESRYYEINSTTGVLSYNGPGEDRATNPSDGLTVRVSDGTHSVDVDVVVTVTIAGMNDAPVFSAPSYAFNLAENAYGIEEGIELGRVSASDLDGDPITYSIAPGNESRYYEINSTTGVLSYNGPGEDHETNPSDVITVRASDGQNIAEVDVTVTIVNLDEAPVFSAPSYDFDLAENAYGIEEGIVFGRVSASDPNGDPITYSIVQGSESGNYEVNSTTGELIYNGPGKDHETNPSDVITVRASDGQNVAEVDVTVTIVDLAEAPVFSALSYNFNLDENTDGSGTSVPLGNVSATDPDGDPITYSIVPGNESGNYEINSTTGVLSYNGLGENHGTNPSDTLTVRASDGTHSVDAVVTVTIVDVNEAPAFISSSYAFELTEYATTYWIGKVSATDPDGDTITYSILPGNESGNYSIDPSTGNLTYSGSGESRNSNPSDVLTVRASDGTLHDDVVVTVTIVDNPEATVNGFYSPATHFVSSVLAEVLEPPGEPFDPGATPPPPGQVSQRDPHASNPLAEGYTIVSDVNAATPAADVGV